MSQLWNVELNYRHINDSMIIKSKGSFERNGFQIKFKRNCSHSTYIEYKVRNYNNHIYNIHTYNTTRDNMNSSFGRFILGGILFCILMFKLQALPYHFQAAKFKRFLLTNLYFLKILISIISCNTIHEKYSFQN